MWSVFFKMARRNTTANRSFTIHLKNEWTVVITNRIPRFGSPEPLMGATYRNVKKNIYRIYVRASMTAMEIFETYLHELGHAFEMDYSLQIAHDLIHALEKPIAHFLMTNYGMTPWKLLSPSVRTPSSPSSITAASSDGSSLATSKMKSQSRRAS